MTTRITRHDYDAADLREQARRSNHVKVACRLLAIALAMEGQSRTNAARACGMERQTLRDWIIRYNEHGIAGLSDQHAGGASPKLTEAEMAQLAAWVRQGPDPEDGLVRWRLADLRQQIMARFFVSLDERSISRILKSLSFSHLSVRPQHPEANTEAQEAHKKTSPTWSPPPSRPRHATSRSSSGGRTKPGSASKAA
jgi:transposase